MNVNDNKADVRFKAVSSNYSLKSASQTGTIISIQTAMIGISEIELEMEYEEETILRREILPNGKTRAFVNDSPVNIKLLKELGYKLIDIHSQNQNLSLSDPEYQMGIVDTALKKINSKRQK